MDCSRTGPNLATSDLDSIRVPRRDVTDFGVHKGVDVKVGGKYTGVGHCSSAVAA